MDPTYLSKIERGENPPPAADKVEAIAQLLGVDSDQLVAMAGKIPTDLQSIAERCPVAMAELARWFQDGDNTKALQKNVELLVHILKLSQVSDWSNVQDSLLQLRKQNDFDELIPRLRRLNDMARKLFTNVAKV